MSTSDEHLHDPRALIIRKTAAEVRTFVAELTSPTTNYRTVQSLTQQIEHQYHGRFAIELLQNAHDALRARPDIGNGRVVFMFDPAEDQHGVLYVANDGCPFRQEDFLALARLGQSSKDPRDSVGHKGLGFRSVLEICDAPMVFSRDPQALVAGAFDGFCFRFSPGVLGDLSAFLSLSVTGAVPLVLDGEQIEIDALSFDGLSERIRIEGLQPEREVRYLSPYVLPLPTSAVPPHVRDFAREGFSTVIRLPLRSKDAIDAVNQRLAQLGPETLLFLESVRAFEVDGVAEQSLKLERTETPGEGREASVRIANVERTVNEEYRVWRTKFGGDNEEQREEIRAAVQDLPESWHRLDTAELCAAVRIGRPAEGRCFIYLPTEILTGAATHLNAPFYGDLKRTHIDFDLPINALLRRALLDWLLDTIVIKLQGGPEGDAVALVDLLAPLGEQPTLLLDGQEAIVKEQPIFLTDRGWTDAARARVVPEVAGASVLTADRLRAHATFCALAPVLQGRLDSARRLIRRLSGSATPDENELATTIESVGQSTAVGSDWVLFWADVERLLPGRAKALVGRRVVLTSKGILVASDPNRTGIRIFFPPRRAESGESVVDAIESVPEVPETLRDRIAFLSDEIPLLEPGAGGRRERTAVRRYLQDALVEEYSAESILRGVVIPSLPEGPVGLGSSRSLVCADALNFAARLVRGARDQATLLPILKELRLPCVGGWFPAQDAAFGPGWPKSDGDLLAALFDELGTSAAHGERDRLLLPPNHPLWSGHGESFGQWAASGKLRITTGLRLHLDNRGVGKCWLQKYTVPHLPEKAPSYFPSELWTDYLRVVAGQLQPSFTGPFIYEWTGQPWFIGIDRVTQLSRPGLRNLTTLLLRSIGQWERGWTKSRLSKQDGQVHHIEVDSFTKFVLERLPWIWTGDESPGACPRDRWFVPAVAEPGQAHQYDHLRPIHPALVRAARDMDPSPLAMLRELGMAVLEPEQSTSEPRLLDELASSVADDLVAPSNSTVFLGQLRAAWAAFDPLAGGKLPTRFVVSRGSRTREVLSPTPEQPVYVPDVSWRGAESGPISIFPVVYMLPRDGHRLFRSLEAGFGPAVRRLSEVKVEPLRGESPWTPSDDIASLSQSGLNWLIPFALCASSVHGSAIHANSKSFREALATLRAARVDRVIGLTLRVAGAEAQSSPAAAFWFDEKKVLLFDDSASDWLSALAPAIAALLDRGDVVNALRLALTNLQGNVNPDEDALRAALAKMEIGAEEFDEVRQMCSGDLAWLVERIAPVVTLSRPSFDLSEWALIESNEALRSWLEEEFGDELPADWVVETARSSASDAAMGRALLGRLGAAAELDRWNEALQRQTPARRPVGNALWQEQFRSARSPLLTPLRAIAAHVCLESGNRSHYAGIAQRIGDDKLVVDLRYTRWEVGVPDVIAAFGSIFAELSADNILADLVQGATNSAEFNSCLNKFAPGLDLTIDPAERLRANQHRLRELFDAVCATAVVHSQNQHGTVGRWAEDMANVRDALGERLSDEDGYLLLLPDAAILARIGVAVTDRQCCDGFSQALELASTIEALRQGLGITEAMIASVQGVLARARDVMRRQRRLVTICGSQLDPEDEEVGIAAWDTLERLVPDAELGDLHPANIQTLNPIGKRSRTVPSKTTSRRGGRPPRMPEGEARLIGLIGEMYAYRLLQKTFGAEQVTAGAWLSENSRAKFPGNPCDDGAGYDFMIVDARRISYIEVKASGDDTEQFELGSSEVRAALEMADRRNQLYRILHVRRVRSRPEGRFLPNPFDRASKDRFDFDQAGFRVRYKVNEPTISPLT